MAALINAILDHLPSRRRRFWRYVSPRRRGAGVVSLALVLSLVYGYWLLTNDGRIRQQAQIYLSEASGGDVQIGEASFSIFGGIELRDVRLYAAAGEGGEPMFRAEKVVLRHRPSSLLGGRLEATEVVCLSPVMTVELQRGDQDDGQIKVIGGGKGSGMAWARNLPPIRLRHGLLRLVEVEDGTRQVREIPLNASLTPAGDNRLLATFEDPRDSSESTIRGQIVLALDSGAVESVTGNVGDLVNLDSALPPRYQKWRQQYDLAGKVSFKSLQSDSDGAADAFEARLDDVQLRLPAEQGGLDLTGVRGTLVFDAEGFSIRDVTGSVRQLAGARMTINGRYNGLAADSPFTVRVEVSDLALPEPGILSEPLARLADQIRRDYSPRGRAKLQATFSRDADGRFTKNGVVEFGGMSGRFRIVPIDIENITGRVSFDDEAATLEEIAGTGPGDCRVRIDGRVDFSSSNPHDIRVQCWDVPLVESIRRAMPSQVQEAWKQLSPGGTVGRVDVTVVKTESQGSPHVTARLDFDGRASLTYAQVPYPLERLRGQVTIDGDSVQITGCRGQRGSMSATIDGSLAHLGDPRRQEVDLMIECRRVGLDKTLAEALGERGQSALAALRPQGVATRVSARVQREAGEELTWEATALIRDAELDLELFPYKVSAVEGRVRLLPGKAVVERLTARRGDAQFVAVGEVLLDGPDATMDLEISGRGVELDESLRAALNPEMRELWASMGPSGKADFAVSIWRDSPGPDDEADEATEPRPHDYRLVLTPRDLSICYRGFPYVFKNIRGRIVAEPGRVRIEDVTASEGEMTASLSGALTSGEKADEADLAITINKLPIDRDLLDAMPAEVASLLQDVKAGGRCDLELSQLRFTLPRRSPTSQPTTAPASASAPASGLAVATTSLTSQPTSAPAQTVGLWSATGSLTLDGVRVDFLGDKAISGKLSGSAGRSGDGFSLDMELAFDSIEAQERKVEKLRARLLKRGDSPVMRLDNLSAKVHGGGVAGFGEIRLGEPIRYGINVSVDNLLLDELLGKGEKRSEVRGLVDGRLQLTGSLGDNDDRRASGVVRISKASMYRVPVLLGLLQVLTLSLPGDTAFTDAEMSYYLKGDELTLEEIWLSGPSLSALGSGSVDLKTGKLRLNFLTAPAGRAPRMKNLAVELLERLSKELMEIRVRGTLSRPQVRTVTLGSLERAIRTMTSPEAED
jgi:hypothetical protein